MIVKCTSGDNVNNEYQVTIGNQKVKSNEE